MGLQDTTKAYVRNIPISFEFLDSKISSKLPGCVVGEVSALGSICVTDLTGCVGRGALLFSSKGLRASERSVCVYVCMDICLRVLSQLLIFRGMSA